MVNLLATVVTAAPKADDQPCSGPDSYSLTVQTLGSRVRSAVGGGNTDEHRQVGIPYPFKAAASKQGDHGGGTNETVLRLMNKSALVNCRWTIRPVLPDGQSVPAKAGGEVSNMDYVYLEQVSRVALLSNG